MAEEKKLHDAIEDYRGEWKIETEWGYINVQMNPERIGFGTEKGTPDEILKLKLTIPILGKIIETQLPILLEDEQEASINGALRDLRLFSERNIKEGDPSHINLSMIVIGNKNDSKQEEIILKCPVEIKERSSL